MKYESPIRIAMLLAALAPGITSAPALAHGDEKHPKAAAKIDYSKAEEHPFGKAADPEEAARVITVEMSDRLRFTPDSVEVKRGDVVRFVVRNRGKLMHEMVLGSRADLEAHAKLMQKFPGMEHEEPYMAHVPPGKAGVMGWRFTNPGEFLYGCLVPGHFEAGMVGRITVR